jgi:hypothetical protein
VPDVAAPPMRPASGVALAAAPAGVVVEAPPEALLFAPALPDDWLTFGGATPVPPLPDPED